MSFSSPILIASVPEGLAQSGTLPSGYNIEYNLSYNGTVFDLYYPNTGSNFPLIVYSGGTGGGKNGETSNAIYFAENGYACLWYATTANSADIYEPASKSNCLSLLPMIFNSTTMNLVCGISIDASAVALTGFSGGAGAMLSINDTRIRTIVSYCPYYVGTCLPAKNTCPVLICCGQSDSTAPYDINGLVFYNGDVQSRMILEMVNGAHNTENGWNYSVSWLNWLLQGNSSALDFVLGISGDSSISRYLQDLSSSDFSSPTPTPTPTLTSSPTPTPSPSPSPIPTPTPSPSPTPTTTPTQAPTSNPTTSPTQQPTSSTTTPIPTAKDDPSLIPTASPIITRTPTPTSTPTVPEFPTLVILPFFAVAILQSILFIRKRMPKK
jgi:type VI secretion system secreted protein VgrG